MGLLEKKILEAIGYDVKNVPLRAARRFLPCIREKKPAEGDSEAVWMLAAHREKFGQQLIAVGHVHMENWGVILGSTTGGEKYAIAPITYEFSSYGGLLAYSRDEIIFYVMKLGERIVVPPSMERTIINLDEDVLIAIRSQAETAGSPKNINTEINAESDAANTTLEEQFGCPLMFWYNPKSSTTTCLLNTRYYHAGIIKGKGVVKGAVEARGLLQETAAIFSEAPGEKLYRAVCDGREQMEKIGVRIVLPEILKEDG